MHLLPAQESALSSVSSVNALLAGSLLTLPFSLPLLPAGWGGQSNRAAYDYTAIKMMH